ncbi:MAG: YciI family protein [Mobiluncus porci]|uniref:YCII-related domain-containing protein n=1 Tax=Mobiluncus porci TaxID=2652278 RepID=A0A7K0K4Q2_9ACTO|nr:YciI family protein [Mobiluncus porci]MDD7541822.1 YciI family protein [Mobiluncus porci]MDY5748670.1 YciI family protein [Mobiluncus porci]MST50419.1 hypothetical protein [Mobiluncus porci]
MKTVVIYTYDPAREADRAALRPKHLAYMSQLQDEGKLTFAGAWVEEPETPGALLLLNTENPEEAREWLQQDPNQLAGIVQNIATHKWNPTVGEVA